MRIEIIIVGILIIIFIGYLPYHAGVNDMNVVKNAHPTDYIDNPVYRQGESFKGWGIAFMMVGILIVSFGGAIPKKKTNKDGKKKKLEEDHLVEIKQLLREHKSLTQIKKKIQGWKKEGYKVDELEKMLENVESDEVEIIESDESNIEKYCSDCGRTVPDDAKFCDYCGEKFDDN